jgi:hypothetical protein
MFKIFNRTIGKSDMAGLRMETNAAMNQAVSDKGDGVAVLRAINAEIERLLNKSNITIDDIDKVIRKVGHDVV